MSVSKLAPSTSVSELKGVGSVIIGKLRNIGIETIGDLVENIPRSFDDYSRIVDISKVTPGKVTLKATIHNVKSRYSKNGLPIVDAVARDHSGQLHLTWFNQPYIAKSIKPEEEYFISGEFARNFRYFAITNPKIELVSAFPKHTARLVPNYRLTKGLSAHKLRTLTAEALRGTDVVETLPTWLVSSQELMARGQALLNIHFPNEITTFNEAKKRLAFEELFVLMLASELNRRDFSLQNSYELKIQESLLKDFSKSLPFTLTDDQRVAVWDMLQMMRKSTPMNSLLQGDVGSGKTVVAVMLAINAMSQDAQVAFMAPTELLANQHYESISKFLPAEYEKKTVLLTGSMTIKSKKQIYERIEIGEVKLIIGTHALIQDKLSFSNLQFIVVDEQHRFGVNQRKALQNKADKMPHVLHMSATPIPRSIALTLYGELDIVTMLNKPSDRKIIQTKVASQDHRQELYKTEIQDVVSRGEQVFVVTPMIEESDTSKNKMSVEKVSKELGRWLPKANIKVIHGKLPADQKDEIMQKMKNGEVDVLVSTTVIEVGIDIPNATTIVIESADSFGLAQLHQLRGRVGRGIEQGRCILVSSKQEANRRLQVMENEHSGFKLAEYDLELRGPGAIYGSMQHGALDLRIASISDRDLIETARDKAKEFIHSGEQLIKYPSLESRVERIRAITNLN